MFGGSYASCRRHGWRRKFSISPSEIDTLSYSHLEAVLELPTLRLRSSNLRIFVENPPNSGNFSKIRFWKDDGSLQSVLVKEFFARRVRDATITVLDVRDGNDREDTLSIRSGIAGSMGAGMSKVSRSAGQTKEWLKEKRRGLGRTGSSSSSRGGQTPLPADEDEDDDEHDESIPVRYSHSACATYLIMASYYFQSADLPHFHSASNSICCTHHLSLWCPHVRHRSQV